MECTTARSCDGYLILAIRHLKKIHKSAIVENGMCLMSIRNFIYECAFRQAADTPALGVSQYIFHWRIGQHRCSSGAFQT